MVLNFYEENKIIYTSYLEELAIFLVGVSYSIYLRGSANKPISHLHFKPWDIDMVLFCREEIDADVVGDIKKITFEFNDKISVMGFPYVDLRFFHNPADNASDNFLLYLLKEDSYVIKGNGSEVINNAKKPHKKELIDLYSKNVEMVMNKYHYLLAGKEKGDEYDHKIKNLIKSISRCGCILLLLKDDVFTRDVNSGLDALHRYFSDDSFVNIRLPLSKSDYFRDIQLALFKMLEYKME